jgi:hypothetical protein
MAARNRIYRPRSRYRGVFFESNFADGGDHSHCSTSPLNLDFDFTPIAQDDVGRNHSSFLEQDAFLRDRVQ